MHQAGLQETGFQFLMVRLKEKVFTLVKKDGLISIPYGAIKSITKEKQKEQKKEFQFLMVRLKAIPTNQKNVDKKDFNSLWCD